MDNLDNTPQTGNVPQGDAAPQQTTVNPDVPVTPTGPVAPVESDEVRGLRQAAEAERKKRQDLEGQLLQTQGLLAQVAAQVRPQAPTPAQPTEEDYLADLSDSDLLDPAKVRTGINKAVSRVRHQVVTEANQTVEQLRFNMQYPDFNTLVGTRDPMTNTFRPSEVLQEAMTENPNLQQQLLSASGQEQARIAYLAATFQKRLRDARAVQQQQQQTVAQQRQAAAQQIYAANTAAAVTAPMSPSAVSGAPANSPQTDYRAMASNPATAAQFDALIQEALRGKFG